MSNKLLAKAESWFLNETIIYYFIIEYLTIDLKISPKAKKKSMGYKRQAYKCEQNTENKKCQLHKQAWKH